jgi:hypothetical protein
MAAFEAVGYAKFSGRVGVRVAASGPGAIHLLNGLYDAKLDHVPVVAIVGQTNRSAMGGSYQQEVDLLSLYKDVASEYCEMVTVPEQLPNVLDRAMRTAHAHTRKQAVRIAAAFADEDVRWFEEPAPSDDLPGLRQVRDAVLADVAAGEYGYDLPYLTRMAASGAVDCLQADATRCGGITVWLRAAAVAEGLGLDLSGHCAPHVHAHAAAAVPNLRHLEWFHDHVRIEELFFEGTLDATSGGITPGHDGAPGHGLNLVDERAEPYRTG